MGLVASCCVIVVCTVHITRRNRYWELYKKELVTSGLIVVLYVVYVKNVGTGMTSCIGKWLLTSLRNWSLYVLYRDYKGIDIYCCM